MAVVNDVSFIRELLMKKKLLDGNKDALIKIKKCCERF